MIQNTNVWMPYTQIQTMLPLLEIVATQGSTLTLADGKQLTDGVGSWWTACHGYNHPHIINAIQQQANQMAHVMLAGLIHPQAKKLAKRIAALLPGSLNYVYFSDSGSIAVEIAMKMALQFWRNQGNKQRSQFLYFEHAYHGDTLFTMSVCDPYSGMHRLFADILPPQQYQALPQDEKMLKAFRQWLDKHSQHIAGMIIEPLVQGAGGMKMHSPQMLKAICEACQQHDILVILDEVFTGFGRTGTFWAMDAANVIPDIVCLAKGLAGGTLPIALTVAQDHIFNAFLSDDLDKSFVHATTFMGNALACAAANASLDLFETEPRLKQVAHIENLLKEELFSLSDVKGVKDVRVKGAIGVVQMNRPLGDDLNWFKQKFIDDEIWLRPFADIVYTVPAFTITDEELRKITRSIIKRITERSTRFK